MNKWKEYKLGEVVTSNLKNIAKDYPFKIIKYLDTGSIKCGKVETYQEFNLEDAPSRAKRLVKEHDIIYSNVRPIQRHYGYIKKPPENLVVSTGFSVISTNVKLADSLYIYYLLSTKEIVELLDSIAEGSTSAYPSLKPSDIENLEIILPPLSEQKEIAGILSSLDDKIDLLHRQNKTLEAIAETLFRQWFVEPCKNGLPEGWEEETFERWIVGTVGGDWGSEKIDKKNTKIVNCLRGTDIAELNTQVPLKTPIRYIKELSYEKIKPKEGDLIIEVSGGTEKQSTGRACYITDDVEKLFDYPIIFSNFCRMIRVRKKEYSFFLYCYLKYLYYQDEFFKLENGSSGIKNFNYKAFLYEMKYSMPIEKKVISFHNEIYDLFKNVNHNKTNIRTLEKLRNTLLPTLLKEEVQVVI